MAVSRLFTEIGKDVDRMNESLRLATDNAKKANIEFTATGRSIISRFDEALNPTKRLAEQIDLLSKVGKSNSDIWKVMEGDINRAAEAAKKNGQAIDPLVKSLQDLNKTSLSNKLSFEKFGSTIQDFARNPVQAAQSGFSGLLGSLGPMAVGMGAVATGVVAAGAAIYKIAAGAADAAEKIQNLSYSTGMTVENVQALQRLGEERGLGDLTGTIQRLNAQLGSKSGGDFVEAILRMGIAIRKGADATYYLEEMRKNLGGITDEATRAQQAAADLGPRLIGSLGPLVLNMKESITDAMDEIKNSEAVMTQAQIDHFGELDNKIDRLGRKWEGLWKKVKLAALEATEPFLPGSSEEKLLKNSEGKILTDSTGAPLYKNPYWNPQPQAQEFKPVGPEVPSELTDRNILAERARMIAEADAIAAGTKKELIGLTIKLNDLEKQYSDIKQSEEAFVFDSKRLFSVSAQIAATKEEIKQRQQAEELSKKFQQQWTKDFEERKKDAAELRKEMEETFQKLNSLNQKDIDASAEKITKDTAERVKAFNEIEARLAKEIATSKLDELKAQKEIIAAAVPMNEQERVQMGLEKAHIDYMIRQEEIRVKYQQIRTELQEKLNKLAKTDPLRIQAEADMSKLGEKEQQELVAAGKTYTAEVLKVHREEYKKMIDDVREGAGSIFDAIVARGKGAFQSLQDWLEGIFLTKLKTIFQNFATGIFSGQGLNLQSIFAGVLPGGTAGSGGWGNIFGGGNFGGIVQSIGAGGITIPDNLAGLSSLQQVMSGGQLQAVEQIGGLGGLGGGAGALGILGKIPGLAGLLGIAPSSAALTGGVVTGAEVILTPSTGLFGLGSATIPVIGAAIAGLAIAVPMLIKAIQGKNSYEAGSMEVARDFGNISVSTDQYKDFLDQLGLSESKAYPYRAMLNRSPIMIQQMAEAAQQQGKLDPFLKSLEEGGSGTWGVDMRSAVEVGMITGDWEKLNEVFVDLVENEGHFANLAKMMGPDWADKLLAGENSLVTANQKLFASFTEFRDAVKNSIEPAESMYQTFLDTGRITDELRQKITDFGGDLAAFEKVSGLSKINSYFQELVQHFHETGEILPDLRRMVEEYGGSLAALDAAAGLPDLMKTSSSIASLTSGLSNLSQQFDPIQKLLSGEMGADVQAALTQAGLDPSRFESLTTMIRAESGWDKISQNALAGGTMSADLQSVLGTYGGAEGDLAVSRYSQGFNTVTQELLDATKAAMDAEYQQRITEALDYLGQVGQDTNAAIEEMTTAVDDQLNVAQDGITESLNAAKEEVVDVLNQILVAVAKEPGNILSPTSLWQQQYDALKAALDNAEGFAKIPAKSDLDDFLENNPMPSLDTGGEVLKTGIALVHKGERYDGGKGSGGSVTLQGCTFYGWDDFVEKVRQAGVDLKWRKYAY